MAPALLDLCVFVSEAHIAAAERGRLFACPVALGIADALNDFAVTAAEGAGSAAVKSLLSGATVCKGPGVMPTLDDRIQPGRMADMTSYRLLIGDGEFVLPARAHLVKRVFEYGHGGFPDLRQFSVEGKPGLFSYDAIVRPFSFSLTIPAPKRADETLPPEDDFDA